MIYLNLPVPVNCRACACYDALRRDCRAMELIDRERDNDVGEDKPEWCPIRAIDFTVMPLVKGDPVAQMESNIYDRVEEHHNCFVQILTNSVTGEISIGWKKEEEG